MAIFPDKRDGKLTGRWRVELQLNGERFRKRFDTIDEARNFEAKARLDIAAGKLKGGKTRVEKGPTVETLEQLARAVEGHLWAGASEERQAHQRLGGAFRVLGPSRLIESITLVDIDRMVKVLRDRGNAPGTINRYMSAVNQALKWALKRGYRVSELPESQWQDEDEGRIRWITPHEEDRLMQLLAAPEACAVYISIRTGLRRGELLNLQPRDVEPRWVHLWGSGTKSGKGRSIPLTPNVYNALKEYFALGKVTVESLRYQWASARKHMQLEEDDDFVFHACRHTFATRAVQAGVHPRVLQRLMGHADLTTTMRYMQVSDGMLAAAIEQMDVHSCAENPIVPTSYRIRWGANVGALQVGENPINAPIDTAREPYETLGNSGT